MPIVNIIAIRYIRLYSVFIFCPFLYVLFLFLYFRRALGLFYVFGCKEDVFVGLGGLFLFYNEASY